MLWFSFGIASHPPSDAAPSAAPPIPHPEKASAPAPAPAAVLADPQDRAWTVLRELDRQIEAVVLSRQHPISGLLPASTAN
ncbi:MAG: hypothetical protein ACKO58_05460, partial [Cyanobium sp.]